ncbi:MAG: DUF177 domain-containing protein [Prevotella sp.]|nr:DUF177 domain-containing protein [Prevotella sp.]
MRGQERFIIDLKGMKEEKALFKFELRNDYFEAMEAKDINGGTLQALVEVSKVGDAYLLDFQVEGVVVVPCDICLADMEVTVADKSKIEVRLGEDYQEDGDLVIIPEEEGTIDVAWFIYELVALAIPTRHVHDDGDCDPVMLRKLEELSASDNEGNGNDPRWRELEKIKSTFKE